MKLSVIVPVHNVKRFLGECIESILGQTMEEIELLLVDDGSTDGSGELCEQYANQDRRIRVLHQTNQGPIAARRKGLEESRSRYVTFVDADDFIAADSYARAESAMQLGVDMVLFGITRYMDERNQSTEYIRHREGLYDKQEIEEQICPGMIWDEKKGTFGIDPSLCTKIMKREKVLSVYETIQNAGFHYGEDMAVAYAMIREAEQIAVKRYSYYYHRMRGRGEVPGYIRDSQYLDKLYCLYQHLRKQFAKDAGLLREIEYFYMYSAGLRKWAYGDYQSGIRYLFPFDRVKPGGRIVLYGAGIVGHAYMEQLRCVQYCEVVLWVDKNHEGFRTEGVSSVENIRCAVFDQIVLAVKSAEIRTVIKEDLLHMGVEAGKIV